MRTILSEYQDPLDIVWLNTCRRWGWKINRSDQVFAAWDGNETLTIGTSETLDADDSLAQLILHEFCHAMVEGPDSWNRPDWGLDITDRSQLFHEHACLVLQAAVSDPFGLRTFFGSTTDARKFYDLLPDTSADLLQRMQSAVSAKDNAICPFAMASRGYNTLKQDRFWKPLQDALAATAAIAEIVSPFAGDTSLWKAVSPGGYDLSDASPVKKVST